MDDIEEIGDSESQESAVQVVTAQETERQGKCKYVTGLVAVCFFIALERFTFSNVCDFLVREFHVFEIQDANETRFVYVFNGCCFFLPILGGLIADLIGRQRTIFAGLFFYTLGLVMLSIDCPALEHPGQVIVLTATLSPSKVSYCHWRPEQFIIFPLVLIAFGAAFVKPNLLTLLLKQGLRITEMNKPAQWFLKALMTTETWFALGFWCISIGEALAWLIGDALQLFSPIVSTSVIGAVFILFIILSKKTGCIVADDPFAESVLYLRQRFDPGAKLPTERERLLARNRRREKRTDFRKRLCTILPCYGLLIMFWMSYSQVPTYTLVQITNSYVHGNLNGGNVSAASGIQGISSTLVTIMLVLLYSLLRGKFGWDNALKKMGLGMISGCLSLLTLAGAEAYRKANALSHLDTIYVLPQCVFNSFGDSFVTISGLYYFYTTAPKTLENMSVGLFLSTLGFGSFIGITISYIANKWIGVCTSDGSCTHLDWYAIILSGILLINFCMFWWYCSRFRQPGGDKGKDGLEREERPSSIQNENYGSFRKMWRKNEPNIF